MARIELEHQPDLRPDELLSALEEAFPQYAVYESALLGIDLVVKKTGWTGVGVKLVQKKDRTFVRLNGMSPSVFARFLLNGLLPMLILSLGPWKRAVQEVSQFLAGETLLLAPPAQSGPGLDIKLVEPS